MTQSLLSYLCSLPLGGIADLQVEGEQVNRLHTREIPHPLDNFEPIHNATRKENV